MPFNAARALRYLDRLVLVTQGEVFYATEVLSKLEGMQRGPAGNTSLAAALAIARELPEDATVVVQETEYTGAGKHPWAQLAFALENGVEVRTGSREENVPGEVIAIPDDPGGLGVEDVDLERASRLVPSSGAQGCRRRGPRPGDLEFLAEETRLSVDAVGEILERRVTQT